MGYDWDSMHAHCIYWPKKHSVSVEHNIKFIPTTFTIYSPAISILAVHPLPAIAQALHTPPLPSLPSGQQPSIIHPASITLSPFCPSSPEALSKVIPLHTKPYPYATKSGEEEMPEEENIILATPASSPVLQPTFLRMPTAPSKGKSPAQLLGTPCKAKDSPAYQQPICRLVWIVEQTKCALLRSESLSSVPAYKCRMPGGLGTLTGADEDIVDIVFSAEDSLFSPLDNDIFSELTDHQELCYMVAIVIQEV